MDKITNRLVKLTASLHLKKYRKQHGLFFVEGSKAILEFIRHGQLPEFLMVHEEKKILAGPVLSIDRPIYTADEKIMKTLSLLDSTPDAIAVFKSMQESDLSEFQQDTQVFYLDNIQDPGNVGTIIRNCVWFGINRIIFGKGTVDPYHPKVVQSSKGAFAAIRFISDQSYEFLKNCHKPVFISGMKGVSLYETKFPTNAVVILGNEARGVNPQISQQLKNAIEVTIPGSGLMESLNVAMAHAIICSEMFRQSLKK